MNFVTDALRAQLCDKLERELGHFLQGGLGELHFSAGLSSGRAQLKHLLFNPQTLTELFSGVGVPFEVVECFVDSLELTVPWFAISSEFTSLTAKKLELTLCPSAIREGNAESVSQLINSITGENDEDEAVEALCKVLDLLSSRFRICAHEAIVRIESPLASSSSSFSTAIELHIQRAELESWSGLTPQGKTKVERRIRIEGVSLWTDVFTPIAATRNDEVVTSLRVRRHKSCDSASTVTDSYFSCIPTLSSSQNGFTSIVSSPIRVADIIGDTSVEIESGDEGTLQIRLHIGSVRVLMTPSQLELFRAFSEKFSDKPKRVEFSMSQTEDATTYDFGSPHALRPFDHTLTTEPSSMRSVRLHDEEKPEPPPAEATKSQQRLFASCQVEYRTEFSVLVDSVLATVTHDDPLGQDQVGSSSGVAKAQETLRRLQEQFQELFKNSVHLSKASLIDQRAQFDRLCPDGGLRLVATQLFVQGELGEGKGERRLALRVSLADIDLVDTTKNGHVPLIEITKPVEKFKLFSLEGNFGQEWIMRMWLPEVRSEVNVHVLDRLVHLRYPRPFFSPPSLPAAPPPLEGYTNLTSIVSPKNFELNISEWRVDLRFPCARGSWKALEDETLRIEIKDVKANFSTKNTTVDVAFSCQNVQGAFVDLSSGSSTYLFNAIGGCDRTLQLKCSMNLDVGVARDLTLNTDAHPVRFRVLTTQGEFERAISPDEVERLKEEAERSSSTVFKFILPEIDVHIADRTLLETLLARVKALIEWRPQTTTDPTASIRPHTYFDTDTSFREDDDEELVLSSSSPNSLSFIAEMDKLKITANSFFILNSDEVSRREFLLCINELRLLALNGLEGRKQSVVALARGFRFAHNGLEGSVMASESGGSGWQDLVSSNRNETSTLPSFSVGCEMQRTATITNTQLAVSVASTEVFLRPLGESSSTWLAHLQSLLEVFMTGPRPDDRTSLSLHLSRVDTVYDHCDWEPQCKNALFRLRLEDADAGGVLGGTESGGTKWNLVINKASLLLGDGYTRLAQLTDSKFEVLEEPPFVDVSSACVCLATFCCSDSLALFHNVIIFHQYGPETAKVEDKAEAEQEKHEEKVEIEQEEKHEVPSTTPTDQLSLRTQRIIEEKISDAMLEEETTARIRLDSDSVDSFVCLEEATEKLEPDEELNAAFIETFVEEVVMISTHFPIDNTRLKPEIDARPLLRLALRNATVTLRLFDGCDFEPSESSQKRNEAKSIEMRLEKVSLLLQRFDSSAALRFTTHVIVEELGVENRMPETFYKRVVMLEDETLRKSATPTVSLRIVQFPNSEGKIHASLLPLRIQLDQYSTEFLENFFLTLVPNLRSIQNVKSRSTPCAPIMEIPVQPGLYPALPTEDTVAVSDENEAIYFKEVTFSPATHLSIDYTGNYIFSNRHGFLLGMVRAWGSLKKARLHLPEIRHRNGCLGVGASFGAIVNLWKESIETAANDVLLSAGPTAPAVRLSNGIRELFRHPIEEWNKADGDPARGLVRGVVSFSKEASVAVADLSARSAGVVQDATWGLARVWSAGDAQTGTSTQSAVAETASTVATKVWGSVDWLRSNLYYGSPQLSPEGPSPKENGTTDEKH